MTPATEAGDGDAARHRRLTELFVRAAALEGPARTDFLRALGGGDESLRPDLESLLAYDDGHVRDEDTPPPTPGIG